MIPGKYDIKLWRGSTWSIAIQQESLDFSDYDEIRMQIRPPFVKGTPTKPALLELTLDNNRISFEDSNTTLRLTIAATTTETLSFNEGVYDLEMVKHVNGTDILEEVVDKLLYGKVTVYGEQTV